MNAKPCDPTAKRVVITHEGMSTARFCLLSLLLVIVAIGVHGGALREWSRNASMRAKAVSATQEQRAVTHAEADRISRRGSALCVVGLCFAVASAVSLFVSSRRREPTPWRVVPVALLIFYVLFQFVMV